MEFISFYGLTLVLVGIGAAYLLSPILGPKKQVYQQSGAGAIISRESELKEAEEQRDRFYAILYELDQDFAVGDLNSTDYQELRSYYKQQAVEALLVLDRLQFAQDQTKTEIEAAVASMRIRIEAKETGPTKTKAKLTMGEVQELEERKEQFCKQCSNKADGGAIFCSKCGKKLPQLHRVEEL